MVNCNIFVLSVGALAIVITIDIMMENDIQEVR